MKRPFYITTTLPYVNAAPHVGFASEIVRADVRARWERMHDAEVVFNTGTDEHGQKIWQKAQDAQEDVHAYVDRYAAQFDTLKQLLHVSYTHFIRTTDPHHITAAQALWRRVADNGFIYKKQYSVKYCVGCEMEKTDSELNDGVCPFHPQTPLAHIDEENYFFRFSALQEPLRQLYARTPDFVVPSTRFHEIQRFVDGGLQDFSISRLAAKMPWGIPVPDDPEHVMYVWFDALTNYISTLGWPDDAETFVRYWGSYHDPRAIQIAGKDNLRQQAAMWQAMLLAAKLPPSRQIFINGFITVDGEKMSKSTGNVIAPSELVDRFGVDGARYLLLTLNTFGDDGDITWDRLIERYNADLANGIGNLVSRVVTLAGDRVPTPTVSEATITAVCADIAPAMIAMDARSALHTLWHRVEATNKYLEEHKPWHLRETDSSAYAAILTHALTELVILSRVLTPFMPTTASAIADMITTRERRPLFARITQKA